MSRRGFRKRHQLRPLVGGLLDLYYRAREGRLAIEHDRSDLSDGNAVAAIVIDGRTMTRAPLIRPADGNTISIRASDRS